MIYYYHLCQLLNQIQIISNDTNKFDSEIEMTQEQEQDKIIINTIDDIKNMDHLNEMGNEREKIS